MKKTMFKITAAIAMLAFFLIGCSTNSAPDVKQSSVNRASSWQTESLGGFNSVATYTPTSNTQIGDTSKKALLIVLHGCTQSYTAYKTAGLEVAADQYGMIVAAPDAVNKAGFQCWSYWEGIKSRTSADYKRLIDLAKHYTDSGQVDPNQVYIAGLSSGGAFTMTTACLAPDIFAGMGIMAGPSAGTSSNGAFSFEGSVATITNNCNSYAGSYKPYFQTQVTVSVAGTSDTTVPQAYAPQNAKVMAGIYGATAGTSTNTSFGTELLYSINGKPVVAQLSATGLSHAWPGGSGASGSYIESHDLNLGVYLAEFFKNYNRRVIVDENPPTVSITSPSNGANLSGTITITADATDDEGVEKVEFYAKGVLIATDTTAPYSATWTTPAYKGEYEIKAIAYDKVNDTASSVTVIAGTNDDTVAPTVSVTGPSGTLSKTVTLTADASDAQTGVSKVEFFVNGTKVGEDTTAPYSVEWDSSTVADGTHSVTAKAYDNAYGGANVKTSSAMSVTVQQFFQTEYTDTNSNHEAAGRAYKANYVSYYANGSDDSLGLMGQTTTICETAPGYFEMKSCDVVEQPDTEAPVVTITTADTVAAGTVELAATATDNKGVTSITYYVNNVEQASTSYTAAEGSFVLKAVAKDAAGNEGTATKTITVTPPSNNVAPTVSITSPTADVEAGTITISATAADSDGSVAKVEFYANGTKIGEDTSAPYSISYAASAGSLNIQAVATDNEGATASANTSITVTEVATNLDVAITSPADGSSHSKGTYVYPGSVTVTGTSTDAVKVTVQLVGATSGTVYKTQTLTSGLANWSTSLSTYVTYTGGYKIKVTAEAADGTTVTKEIAITISLL